MKDSDWVHNDSDKDLVFRFQSGETKVFNQLYVRHYKRVERFVQRWVGDSAFSDRGPDIVQDIWVAVFKALPDFAHQASFTTWLFKIALNHLYDDCRRLSRRKNDQIDDLHLEAPDSNPEAIMERRERAEWVHKALSALPEQYRQVLVLREVHEHTYEEIANFLDLSLSNTKTRIYRGRAMLHDILSNSYLAALLMLFVAYLTRQPKPRTTYFAWRVVLHAYCHAPTKK